MFPRAAAVWRPRRGMRDRSALVLVSTTALLVLRGGAAQNLPRILNTQSDILSENNRLENRQLSDITPFCCAHIFCQADVISDLWLQTAVGPVGRLSQPGVCSLQASEL